MSHWRARTAPMSTRALRTAFARGILRRLRIRTEGRAGVEEMIHNAVMYLVSRSLLFVLVLFSVRMVICTTLERLQPAHPLSYRKVIGWDLVAAVVFGFVIVPAANWVSRWLSYEPSLSDSILSLPLIYRIPIYIVIADFGYYWIHRLMHSRYFWRVHKWHHSPTYMYWLAGIRGSFFQQILVNLPYIFAEGVVRLAPWWMALAIGLKNSFQNDWMHLNVRWGSRWVEWFISTPRYHHIHHSDDPRHYGNNLSALFPIWDRLFGTHVDPDTVPHNMTFGIGEHVPPVRLAIGV